MIKIVVKGLGKNRKVEASMNGNTISVDRKDQKLDCFWALVLRIIKK